MGLILRGDKESKLTIEEMDGNLTYLDNKSGGSGYTGVLIQPYHILTYTNGSLTTVVNNWSYEGVMTVGVSKDGIKQGYDSKAGFGSMNPEENIRYLYWDSSTNTLVSPPANRFSIDGVIYHDASEVTLNPFTYPGTSIIKYNELFSVSLVPLGPPLNKS